MMKNSKLSKLLVAGVSVAMLASAVAPMAFAEETSDSSVAYNATLKVNVGVDIKDDATTDGEGWVDLWSAAKTGWKKHESDRNQLVKEKNILINVTTDGTPKIDGAESSIDLNSIVDFEKLNQEYEIIGWAFKGTGFEETTFKTGSIDLTTFKQGTEYEVVPTSGTIYNCETNLTILVDKVVSPNERFKNVQTDLVVDNADITTAGSYNRDYGYKKAIEVEGDELNLSNVACLSDSIVVPSYKVADGYVWKDVKVEVFDSDAGSDPVITRTFKDMGSTIKLSDLGIKAYLDKAGKTNLDTITVKVVAEVEQKKGVMLTLSKDAWTLSKDAKGNDVRADSGKNVVVVNELDNALFTKYDGLAGSEVYSDADVTLPAVVILDADDPTKADEDYTFLGWEVIKTDTNKLADSKKVAATYRFEDGVFSATVFETTKTPGDTKVTVVPVFSKAEEEKVITYGEMETPYDKVDWFINGEKQLGKVVWAKHYSYVDENGKTKGWEGGLFIDTKNGVAKMYSTVKKAGEYFLDTTVNGLVDGYVFDKGVQDTKACGLYKVSDKDTFSYLVSNGVYLADYGEYNEDEKRYEGLWISEDKVWYYLVNGCCQTPADGVYEHTNGWYYNFKDGKMVETNGFQMHGTDFYWFVKGECKPEGGADCVEWDGDLYYIEGGKFVPTFNDTFKGSVFVNGVCDK